MVALGWSALAVLVLLASFGAGWWFALLAVVLAWATRRYHGRRVLIASAAAGLGATLLWLALIPSTPGSEGALVILALISAGIALASFRQVANARPETYGAA